MKRFAGTIAVVTGALGAIGAAIVDGLAAEGAGVLLTDVDGEACEKAAADYPAAVVGCALDVTDPGSWQRALRLARRRFGYPTVLVNNAGVVGVRGLQGIDDAEWHRVVSVNQTGTYHGMRLAVPAMQLAGGGAIVNVGSVFGLVGSSAAFAYHAAKGSVRAMTAAAAVELAETGVRVNAVYPGLVDTTMTHGLPEGFRSDVLARTPMRRCATPSDVASAVLFLASDQASYITGAELVVDGGFTAM